MCFVHPSVFEQASALIYQDKGYSKKILMVLFGKNFQNFVENYLTPSQTVVWFSGYFGDQYMIFKF